MSSDIRINILQLFSFYITIKKVYFINIFTNKSKPVALETFNVQLALALTSFNVARGAVDRSVFEASAFSAKNTKFKINCIKN